MVNRGFRMMAEEEVGLDCNSSVAEKKNASCCMRNTVSLDSVE